MNLETTEELITLDDQSSNIVNINETNDNFNQNATEIVNNDNANVTLTNEIKISIDNTDNLLVNNTLKDANEIDRPKQRILVCVGVPGSGKSTFSKRLCQIDNIWYRVNQDDLGSRKACESILRAQLNKGKNVIVDRCNFDREQRKTWINLAHHFNLPIDAIILDTPYDICESRILKREDHPTQVYGTNGLGILENFRRMFKLPDYNEGFERILSVKPHEINGCNEDDVKNIMRKFDEIPNSVVKQSEREREGREHREWGKGKSDRGRGRGTRGRAKNSRGGGRYVRGRGRGNNNSKNVANSHYNSG